MLALCVVAGRTSTGITPWGTHSFAGLIDAKAYLGLFSCQVSSAKPLWHVAIPPTRFGNIDALLRVGEAQTNWFSLTIRPVVTKTIQATLADSDALNEDVRQRQAKAFSGTASHIRCAGYDGSAKRKRVSQEPRQRRHHQLRTLSGVQWPAGRGAGAKPHQTAQWRNAGVCLTRESETRRCRGFD